MRGSSANNRSSRVKHRMGAGNYRVKAKPAKHGCAILAFVLLFGAPSAIYEVGSLLWHVLA